jgi:hypothetical protein
MPESGQVPEGMGEEEYDRLQRGALINTGLDLGKKMGELESKLTVAETVAGSVKKAIWWLVGVVTAIVVAGVVIVLLQREFNKGQDKANDSLTCIRDWANATTKRAEVLTKLNTRRLDAEAKFTDVLDRILRQAFEGPIPKSELPKVKADYFAASNARKQAEAVYDKAVHDQPVPPAPKFSC